MKDKNNLCLTQLWPGLLQRQVFHDLYPGQAASAQLSLYTKEHQLSTVLGQVDCYSPHLHLLMIVVLYVCSSPEVCVFHMQAVWCVLKMSGGQTEEMR